ncbi:MAG: hypothetical protein ACUVXG_02235 [Anaerolineae bacterium]
MSAPRQAIGEPMHPSGRGANLLLASVLAVGLALRLAVAWQDVVGVLIPKVLSDDAFYYFRIAENVARGLGPTFDGQRLTNGFHPLWAVVLAGLCLVQSTGALPIPWALTFSALLDVGTGLLLYLVTVCTLGWRGPALLASLAYLLHPLAVLEGVNGLETALATFAFAVLFAFYVLTLRPCPTWANYALFGLLAGLMVLARTDYAFLVVALGFERLWAGRGRAVGRLALAGGVFVLAVAPWLLWSQTAVGSLVQTSGLAVPFVIRKYLFELSADTLVGPWRWLGPPLYLSYHLAQGVIRYAGAQGLVVGGLLVAWVVARQRGRIAATADLPGPEQGMVLFLPLVVSVLYLGFHAFGRWFLRGWYYAPLMLAAAFLVGWMTWRVAPTGPFQSRQKPLYGAVGLTFVAVAALQGWQVWAHGLWPWQSTVVEASVWAGGNLPAGSVLGAFNAGIPGYYAGFDVVNLDGVVNAGAFAAIRQGHLLAYIQDSGITHVLDWRSTVEGDYRPFFEGRYLGHLAEVRAFPDPYHGEVVIYRVQP